MSESINIPTRPRSSSESSVGSANNKPSSVKAALPSRSPFSAQPFKDNTTATSPQAMSIQPPRRLSGSSELSGQPSPTANTGSGITGLFRRFSFKGNSQPSSIATDAPTNLNTIPAKQPLQTEATAVQPNQRTQANGRRSSVQKRSVSPMGERILRGSFDGSGF